MTAADAILAEVQGLIQAALTLDELDEILDTLSNAQDEVENAKYEMEIAGEG
jgi:hypothetical protein